MKHFTKLVQNQKPSVVAAIAVAVTAALVGIYIIFFSRAATNVTSINNSSVGTGTNQFEFVGAWTANAEASSYGGDEHYTSVAGAYYQVRFNGNQAKVYTTTDTSHGMADIYIDGVLKADNVDTYSAVRTYGVPIWTSEILPEGAHTLKVEVTGSKNAAAIGTAIVADRVDVSTSVTTPVTGSFSVAAVGDMNPSGNTSPTSPSGKNATAISAGLADGSLKAFFGLGDYQYGDIVDCNTLVNHWGSLWKNVIPNTYHIAGPYHDWVATSERNYREFWNGQCPGSTVKSAAVSAKGSAIGPGDFYSFDIGNWHFAALSTGLWQFDVTKANQVTTQLDQDLAAAKSAGKHLAVLYHDPYFTSDTAGHTREFKVKPWIDVMDKYDVRLTLSGSQHNYERSCPILSNDSCTPDDGTGTTAFQVSTGGISLRDFTSSPSYIVKRFSDTQGWLKLTFNDDGSFSWVYNPVLGTGTDSGSRVKPGGSTTPPPVSSTGTTYYVDCNGDNLKDGKSEATAWRDLSKANAASLASGDRMLFKKGCIWPVGATWSGSLVVKWSGVTIGSYGTTGERPIIRTTGNIGRMILVTGSNNTIDGLRTEGPNGKGSNINLWGIVLETGSKGNTVKNSYVTGMSSGIFVSNGSSLNKIGPSNEIVDNRMIRDPGGTNDDSGAFGINLQGNDNEIFQNKFQGQNAQSNDYGLDGAAVELYTSCGMPPASNNKIYHNISINDNTFSEQGRTSGSTCTTVPTNNVYAYNKYTASGISNAIFLNIRGGEGSGGFAGFTYSKAYNNTAYIVGSSKQPVICGSNCDATHFTYRNNIVVAGQDIGVGNSAVSNNHLYIPGSADSRYNVDPKFVNLTGHDFHLTSSSPAIDTGSSESVTAGFTKDLDNLTVPSGSSVDKGVYEYVGSSTPPPPPPVAPPPPPPAPTSSTKLLIADNGYVNATATDGKTKRLLITDEYGNVLWKYENPLAFVSTERASAASSGPLGARWLGNNKILATFGTGEIGVIDTTSSNTSANRFTCRVSGFNGDYFRSPYEAEMLPDGKTAIALRYGTTSDQQSQVAVFDFNMNTCSGSGQKVWKHYIPHAHSVKYRPADASNSTPRLLIGGFGSYATATNPAVAGVKEVTYNNTNFSDQRVVWSAVSEYTHDAVVASDGNILLTNGYYLSKVPPAGNIATSQIWKKCVKDESKRIAHNPKGGFIVTVNQESRTDQCTPGFANQLGKVEFRDDGGNLIRSFSELKDSNPTSDHWAYKRLDYAYGIQVISDQTAPQDTTPPIVSINSPITGCNTATPPVCSGTITATASATDNVGVAGVQFKVNGVNAGTEDTISPYSYSLNTLTLPNGSHTISATARDSAGLVTTSTVIINVQNTDTVAPNPPSSLSGTTTQPTSTTPGSVALTWPAATDNGSPASGIKGYYVYRGTEAISPLVTGTSYTDSNLTAGTYTYSVRSVDNVNLTSTTASPNYNTILASPPVPSDTTPPTTPTNLTASAQGSTQVNLSWTASTDASGIKGYNIYRNGSTTPLNGTNLVTTMTYGDATVSAATTYAYEVEAIDGVGNKSARSSQVSVNVPAPVTGLSSINDGTVGTGTNQFEFAGLWTYNSTEASSYGGDEHYTNASGSYYQVRFSGTQAKVYTTLDPRHGIAAISIDGGPETMVDTYAANRAYGVPIYTSPILTNAPHVIKVRVTGTKNPSASSAFIVADRVDVGMSSDTGAFTVSTEAESMTLPTGTTIISDSTASVSKALRFYTNGTASGSFSLPSAATKITVRVKGSQCEGSPHMVIKVDGVQVQAAPVSATSWTDYIAPINTTGGNHSISISFTNDYSKYTGKGNLKCSRDLDVDRVTFSGS